MYTKENHQIEEFLNANLSSGKKSTFNGERFRIRLFADGMYVDFEVYDEEFKFLNTYTITNVNVESCNRIITFNRKTMIQDRYKIKFHYENCILYLHNFSTSEAEESLLKRFPTCIIK